jgi:hypothetical protein
MRCTARKDFIAHCDHHKQNLWCHPRNAEGALLWSVIIMRITMLLQDDMKNDRVLTTVDIGVSAIYQNSHLIRLRDFIRCTLASGLVMRQGNVPVVRGAKNVASTHVQDEDLVISKCKHSGFENWSLRRRRFESPCMGCRG